MALDAANFISELSIVDPPGTDPLSQGDDQIRTTKRAVQQSFPLIAAAVNIDDVQMNLMAIKNETNLFTTQQTIFGDLVITKAADTDRFGVFYNDFAGFRRWALIYDRTTTGGEFLFDRRDAAGVSIDNPWSCDLTTGIVDFAQVPTVQGAPLWIAGEVRQFVDGAVVPGTNWFYANGTLGTVDLRNRIMMGDGVAAAGTLQLPNLVGTAAASVTNSTVLNEAQMPSHTHRHGMTQGTVNGAADTTQIEDQSAGTVANDPTRNFHVITEPTGGGGGHNHVMPALGVTENGTDRDTVRPLSAVVRFFQYVP